MDFRSVLLALVISCSLIFYHGAEALERLPLDSVSTGELQQDIVIKKAFDDASGNTLLYIYPLEYWYVALTNTASISQSRRDATCDLLNGLLVIGVLVMEVTPLGGLDFYTKDELLKGMVINYVDSAANEHQLDPIAEIDPDVQLILDNVRLVMASSMGRGGASVEMVVVADTNSDGTRLVDPYVSGKLVVGLMSRKGAPVYLEVEMPFNSLFVPRLCPNGKPAHVSWRYCPWTGEPLPR